jgi:hypothetical protein
LSHTHVQSRPFLLRHRVEEGRESPAKLRWPARLRELCRDLQRPSVPAAGAGVRQELWVLLNTALAAYVRRRADDHLDDFSAEDLDDLVAEKSSALQRRAESGEWDLARQTAGEIAAYLSHVGGSGLLLLREGEQRAVRACQRAHAARMRKAIGGEGSVGGGAEGAAPIAGPDPGEYTQALIRCAGDLEPRTRLIWFCRVFLRMGAREIAAHPEVGLKPVEVEVILRRARCSVQQGMLLGGYELRNLPPGGFARLWRAIRAGGRPS